VSKHPLTRPRGRGRRSAAGVLALVLSACGDAATVDGGAPATSLGPGPGSRPDVVLVVVDTLRADHVGIYGHALPTTPNLDSLARDGLWFRRAYSQSSWTLPAFGSLLTGLYPHRHGAGRHPTEVERFGRLAHDARTLAELLTGAGYRCGAVVNNTFLAPEFGFARGFGADYFYRGADERDVRSAEDTVAAGLAWLDAGKSPAFLLLHFMEPHLDYDPAPSVRGTFTGPGPAPVALPWTTDEWLDSFEPDRSLADDEQLDYIERLYDEEILAADRGLGRLLDGLTARGRFERTLLVVTSDHGEEFFDHGSFEHGHTLFSELIRVPLVVRAPGIPLELRGRPQDVLVQHVDVFQTVLRAAGVAAPESTVGEDLFALVARGAEAPARFGLAEGVLYGPPLTTVVGVDLRFQLDLLDAEPRLWRLDAAGREEEPPDDPDGALLASMRRALIELRGNADPVVTGPGPVLHDRETFLRLKALGYVSEGSDE